MRLVIRPQGALRGEVAVPGDKSISHRAALMGALARGTTEISGFLPGADCLSTLSCLGALGVAVEAGGDRVVVHGRGLRGLEEPAEVVDAGNSGTTLRLLLGILAGSGTFTVLKGDASLNRRPMRRVTAPLAEMGAGLAGREGGNLAPLCVYRGVNRPWHHRLPVASAQVKSALLLAGLYPEGKTRVEEPAPSRDHTERMLASFGAAVRFGPGWAEVEGGHELQGQRVVVPRDFSSAAFLLAAAVLVPGSEVVLPGIGLNPTRTGFLDALGIMGGQVELRQGYRLGQEPAGDLVARGSRLKCGVFGGDFIPRAIDEIPILAVTALAAQGTTVIKDAAELRVKESDRLEALARELGRLGGRVTAIPDGLVIEGGRPLKGNRCYSGGDHRIAMALAVAGLLAEGQTVVEDAACVAVSYPGFAEQLGALAPGCIVIE